MQVIIALVALEIRCEFIMLWNMADLVPDASGSPATNIPEFRSGKTEGVKIVSDLRAVLNTRFVGARDDLFRYT